MILWINWLNIYIIEFLPFGALGKSRVVFLFTFLDDEGCDDGLELNSEVDSGNVADVWKSDDNDDNDEFDDNVVNFVFDFGIDMIWY